MRCSLRIKRSPAKALAVQSQQVGQLTRRCEAATGWQLSRCVRVAAQRAGDPGGADWPPPRGLSLISEVLAAYWGQPAHYDGAQGDRFSACSVFLSAGLDRCGELIRPEWSVSMPSSGQSSLGAMVSRTTRSLAPDPSAARPDWGRACRWRR